MSFIVSPIFALIFIGLGIYTIIKGDSSTGGALIAVGIFAFTFSGTMILNNTFVPDLWSEVASWGFVKLPGVIFEFSIDGFIFLIAIKIIFFIFGMLLAIVTAILATIVCAVLSVVVYPFALIRNVKNIK